MELALERGDGSTLLLELLEEGGGLDAALELGCHVVDSRVLVVVESPDLVESLYSETET